MQVVQPGGVIRVFAGLRLSGNTFWLEAKDWQAFAEYEDRINHVIGRYRMLALCTYSLQKCGVLEVLAWTWRLLCVGGGDSSSPGRAMPGAHFTEQQRAEATR